MGLFSNEAHTTLDNVNNFSNELNNFSNLIETISSTISNNINSELEEAMVKVKELENLVSELSTQLSNTPKEIEVEKKNSDGTVSVSKKPNPDYARIEREIKEAKTKLSQVKDLSWKVYNKVSELSREVTSAYQYYNVIQNKQKDVTNSFNELRNKTNSALSSIKYAERAIQDYLNVRFYK